MIIKEDLKRYIQEHLNNNASPIFIERTLEVIDKSSDDTEGLFKASERISNMVRLFIDKKLADTMFEDLRKMIENNK